MKLSIAVLALITPSASANGSYDLSPEPFADYIKLKIKMLEQKKVRQSMVSLAEANEEDLEDEEIPEEPKEKTEEEKETEEKEKKEKPEKSEEDKEDPELKPKVKESEKEDDEIDPEVKEEEEDEGLTPCKTDEECQAKNPFNICREHKFGRKKKRMVCAHKDAFPLMPSEIVGSVVLTVIMALNVMAGIGGGGVVIPLLMIFF